VVIINESMARAYFGVRDAVGRRIAWDDRLLQQYLGVGAEMRTIVGVVADTRDHGVDVGVTHEVYNPYPQVELVSSLVVRVARDPEAVLPGVRRVVRAHDPDQPIANVATLEQLGSEAVAPRRLNAVLLGGFAGLALLIAAVGIGGVLAFSVGSRTREFGIKSAIGAARHQVWSGVVAEGAMLAGAGVLVGGVAAAVLTRFVSGLLVGVSALDPVTFGAVAMLLFCVAITSAWVPAWRAAHVSPVEALASE
jgi:putative ABC transport system permease protein